MLRRFRAAAHSYVTHVPQHDDVLSWLTLMQHHGAPTRLLDCTMSFPVAAFFAARDADDQFCIWAFHWRMLMSKVRSRLHLDDAVGLNDVAFHDCMHDAANEFLTGKASGALALAVWPRWSHPRLEAQQGMFLFPTDPARSLLENLGSMLGEPDLHEICEEDDRVAYTPSEHGSEWAAKLGVLKLVVNTHERIDTLRALRDMNVHEASLFPGLDGFARSLGTLYALRDKRE